MGRRFENIAQVVILLFALLILIAMFMTVQAQSPEQQRECVVEIYRSQVGVREATGHNDGKQVKEYLASCGLAEGPPWCAAFVNWTLKKCGAPKANSAWSPAWFPQGRVVFHNGLGLRGNADYVPRAGDVFGIYFPSKKRIAHVGFIDDWNVKRVRTIEGNTNQAGSREGDGVYIKYRLPKQIYIVSNWIDKL